MNKEKQKLKKIMFPYLHKPELHIDPPIQGSLHPCSIEHEVPGFNDAAQVTKI